MFQHLSLSSICFFAPWKKKKHMSSNRFHRLPLKPEEHINSCANGSFGTFHLESRLPWNGPPWSPADPRSLNCPNTRVLYWRSVDFQSHRTTKGHTQNALICQDPGTAGSELGRISIWSQDHQEGPWFCGSLEDQGWFENG